MRASHILTTLCQLVILWIICLARVISRCGGNCFKISFKISVVLSSSRFLSHWWQKGVRKGSVTAPAPRCLLWSYCKYVHVGTHLALLIFTVQAVLTFLSVFKVFIKEPKETRCFRWASRRFIIHSFEYYEFLNPHFNISGILQRHSFSSFYYSFKGLREGKLVSHIYLFYWNVLE